MATSRRHGTAPLRASATPPLLLALTALLLLVPGPPAAAALPDHLKASGTTTAMAMSGRHLAAASASILDEDDLDLDALDPIPAELPDTLDAISLDTPDVAADDDASEGEVAHGDGTVFRLLAATTKKQKKNRSPPPPPPRSLKRWSSPYTWPNGTVPGFNATVEIPKGTTVLLDASPPQLFLLKVLGTLVFGDVDLHLTVGIIAVVDGGRLEIGTQAKPYLNEAVITFVGDQTWASLWGWGTKGLVVSGGTVEMVGRTVTSWTHLAETAPVGARLVRLAAPVTGWRVGDQVGFAPTDYDPLEAETRRITKISTNRRVIALSERLDYQHWGETEQVAGPNNTTVTLDERAEVALLTRNIRLEGAPEATGKFGGHVMVLSGRVTLVGVELTAMGQRGHLGRYPVHFHYTYNTSAGSLVRDSAVHHCFQRGFVIHRTNNVTIDRNVVFDSYGHHYFLESAIEMFNNFTGNLAVLVRTPPLEDRTDPIQGDIDPPLIVAYGDREYTENVKYSGFWITNSHNRFVGNAVAGVANGHGFWFLQGVRTPGRDDDITDDVFAANYNRPLLEFRDNVAHTVMRDQNEAGFNVGYGPSTTGSCFQLDRMYDPNNLNASTVYINVPPSAPPPPPPSPSDSLAALASARAASSTGDSSSGYDTIYDPPNPPLIGGTAYKCNFCGLWYPESPATVASGMVIADSLLGILAPEGPVDYHVLAQNITIVARSKNQPADRNLEWFWSSLEPILAGPTAVSTAPEHIDSIMVLDDVSLVGPFTTEDFMGDQGSPYVDRHK